MNSNNHDWWKDAIIYELYVDKFAGNFKTLTEKLDYFNYLGVNTLWLLPHYQSPMIDGGYDISDYNSIRGELGSMADFEKFVRGAHQKNLKIIIDLVLNHTSDMHPWFLDARTSKESSKRDWYIWSDNADKFSEAFVHFTNIKSSNWIHNDVTNDFYYATFYPQQPDLNWDNIEVYKAMIEVMEFWLGKGVDGFRLDAISRLIKRENTNCFALPETHNVLKRIRSDISAKYPDALFMAESGGWPNEAKTFFGNQDECQMVINFPLASNLLSSISDWDLSGVQKAWDESGGIGENCRWGIFLTNHDSVDLFFLTDEGKKQKLAEESGLLVRFGHMNSSSFAARLSEICQGDENKILWAFDQQFKLAGVPILYYGNEIGMRNAELESIPADPREFVRGDFDWEMANNQMKKEGSLLNRIRGLILKRTV